MTGVAASTQTHQAVAHRSLRNRCKRNPAQNPPPLLPLPRATLGTVVVHHHNILRSERALLVGPPDNTESKPIPASCKLTNPLSHQTQRQSMSCPTSLCRKKRMLSEQPCTSCTVPWCNIDSPIGLSCYLQATLSIINEAYDRHH